MTTSHLFVYGTLKRGQRSNLFLADQEFVRAAITLPHYRLYDGGPYPCLVRDPQRGVAVQGEIWQVDEQTLRRLDEWEGVPQDYLRQEIAIEGFAAPVWAYFFRGDVTAFKECGAIWPPP